jgi:DNA polymerase
MHRKLSPDQKRAAAARIAYYREMGIHDFYRRGASAGAADAGELCSATSGGPGGAAGPTNTDWIAERGAPGPSDEEVESVLNGAPSLPPVISDPVAALRAIQDEIGPNCTRCKLHKLGRKQVVFGVGNPRAELMFVGEGPGADEDEQGEPFVGRAGQLLNKMIEAMGLKRSEVYIANVVKCRPPSNRTPERDECDTCSPFLLRQIDAIQPKAIVALGATAAKALLQINDTMASMRSRTYEFRGARLFVTYHPAYLLRDPRQKAETWKDLQQVMSYLGLALPATKKD